jgi:hypothetical protein
MGGLLALVVGGAVAYGEISTKGPGSPGLETPRYLPDLARALLHERMRGHADRLQRLTAAVVLLRYDEARVVASEVSAGPWLTRPTAAAPDALNSLLPPRFFDLQEALRQSADAVRVAAAERDNAALAKGLARVTETCVSCHSAYLQPGGR